VVVPVFNYWSDLWVPVFNFMNLQNLRELNARKNFMIYSTPLEQQNGSIKLQKLIDEHISS